MFAMSRFLRQSVGASFSRIESFSSCTRWAVLPPLIYLSVWTTIAGGD
ncbi:MAG: hypothetical protein WKH64_03995 [Chloroflexia bacterium]